jgi:hypothetical protein
VTDATLLSDFAGVGVGEDAAFAIPLTAIAATAIVAASVKSILFPIRPKIPPKMMDYSTAEPVPPEHNDSLRQEINYKE